MVHRITLEAACTDLVGAPWLTPSIKQAAWCRVAGRSVGGVGMALPPDSAADGAGLPPACRYTAGPVAGSIQRSVSTARARSERANMALVVSGAGARFCASVESNSVCTTIRSGDSQKNRELTALLDKP